MGTRIDEPRADPGVMHQHGDDAPHAHIDGELNHAHGRSALSQPEEEEEPKREPEPVAEPKAKKGLRKRGK